MLTDLDLPLSLWAEAAGTAVYIQDRSPHAVLREKLALLDLQKYALKPRSKHIYLI